MHVIKTYFQNYGGIFVHNQMTVLTNAFCQACGNPINVRAELCPKCGVRNALSFRKSKTVAALLAFFLGGFGAHKFYLGRPGLGILYIIFFWTFIPGIIAFIEFIIFLSMNDSAFSAKYDR